MKLQLDFYLRDDVVQISKELLGKYLFTRWNEKTTGGIITETEAYSGVTDRASHAYGGKHTERTKIMYREGGTAYIYLCYGIHSLFNVVTNAKGIPHAILIRALKPTDGIELMMKRRNLTPSLRQAQGTGVKLCSGPGTVSQALDIHYSHSGKSLLGKEIWIEDKGVKINPKEIIAGARVGVDYAGEDAKLPYRFKANVS